MPKGQSRLLVSQSREACQIIQRACQMTTVVKAPLHSKNSAFRRDHLIYGHAKSRDFHGASPPLALPLARVLRGGTDKDGTTSPTTILASHFPR